MKKTFIIVIALLLVAAGCSGDLDAPFPSGSTADDTLQPNSSGDTDPGMDPEPDGDADPAPDTDENPVPTPAGDDAVSPGPVVGSKGCGNRNYPLSGTYTIDVNGTAREYIVTLPDGYDPATPYRLVFAWHYMGGSAAGIALNGSNYGYYGLKGLSENTTIFVAGQGLSSGGVTGWGNTGGRDVAFAKAIYETLRENYCVDEARVFSTGMSYGGIMSNTLGCAMGDVFRAIAPMSGMGPDYFTGRCTGKVAAWIAHGKNDNVIPFSAGQASRDHWLEANGCTAESTPTSPSPCVAYDWCEEGYPVHWCEFEGGHTIPTFAAGAIWQFFMQF